MGCCVCGSSKIQRLFTAPPPHLHEFALQISAFMSSFFIRFQRNKIDSNEANFLLFFFWAKYYFELLSGYFSQRVAKKFPPKITINYNLLTAL